MLSFVEHLPTLTPRVPVLFITSMGEKEEEKARKKFPVLRKPFSADVLMATLKTLVLRA
jgi:CheY-like chemotaxis protein